MDVTVMQLLTGAKEGIALILLALTLFKFIPALVAALDRNSRILYRIEGKLGLTDSDRIPAQDKKP